MKFSDVIIATASIVLIGLILDTFLGVAFAPLNSHSMSAVAWVISFLVAALIVGYVFALKIQEESMWRAIGSVVVLSAFVVMLSLAVWFANPLVSPDVKDELSSMFNTSGWTTNDWAAYLGLAITLDDIIALVLSFIGLYVGSMLRKPKKS